MLRSLQGETGQDAMVAYGRGIPAVCAKEKADMHKRFLSVSFSSRMYKGVCDHAHGHLVG